MQDVLVGVTTYAGNFETRLILRKTLRHFRRQNGRGVRLLVVWDGPVDDREVHALADHVMTRPGPSGLHQGELDNIALISEFASQHRYRIVIKSAGDIIMNKPDWVRVVVDYFRSTG